MTLHLSSDPERMTPRAQAYLFIGGFRHIATGCAMIFAASRFTSASFIPIINTAPLWMWGVLSLIAGATMWVGSIWRSERYARIGLMVSAAVTGMIAAGLTLAALQSSVAGVVGALIYISVTGKDLVQCLDPIRSPFEGLFRSRAASDDPRPTVPGGAV